MPVTPSDPTPAELLALQALLDRSTRTATPAVADSVAYPARQMPAGEFVEFWRSPGWSRWRRWGRVASLISPESTPSAPERCSDSASTRTPSVGRTSPLTPASPSPPGGLTARSRSSTAARARSQAACARRGQDRAAGRAASSRSRFSSRASTRCAGRSASRACPPRPGSAPCLRRAGLARQQPLVRAALLADRQRRAGRTLPACDGHRLRLHAADEP
jgi:hypothetical protein